MASEARAARAGAQKFTFQAEVNRLMDIIIHSLYSKKDVFLRELISNASDALDKIRLLALTDRKQLGEGSDTDLDIRVRICACLLARLLVPGPDPPPVIPIPSRAQISVDKEKRLLLIRDKGVGMTREDLMNNLGTIAKSGTAAFLEQYKQAQDSNLIGQFGVGFYSAYLVADYVEVITKHNNGTQLIWESGADGSFSISEDTEHEPLSRGTLIKLHLREDCPEYLDTEKLKELATRYSEFINYPIYLEMTEKVEVEKPVDVDEADSASSEGEPKADEGVEDEEEGKKGQEDKPKTKKVTEERTEFKRLNDHKAIWTRNPAEVNESEYHDFYKSVFKRSWEEPMSYSHFKGEGDVEFRAVLFIPNHPEHGFYDKFYQQAVSRLLSPSWARHRGLPPPL